MFDRLHLAQPHWLWLLLLLPLAFWLQARAGRAAALRLPSLAPLGEDRESRRNRPAWLPHLPWRTLLLTLPALALLILALARPQRDDGHSAVQFSGIDLMLTVDVSTSMEALDFTVNGMETDRLTAVKRVMDQFIDERRNDRIGLVAFSGNPYLVTPLTLDHDLLRRRLASEVRMGRVEDGTAIGTALAASIKRLEDSDAKSKIVILLTDGMNNAGEANPLTVAEAARALGIKVYTIGADTNGTARMPVTDPFGRRMIAEVPVQIDEKTLQAVATTTGGRYFRATDTRTLEQVYATIDQLEKSERVVKRYDNRLELFPFALWPGLGLLLLGTVLAETRYRSLP